MADRFWSVEPKLERRAAALYNDDLPYHNYSVHVQRVLDRAHFLLNFCERGGVKVQAQSVYRGVLFHDAGYDHDGRQRIRFVSKEAYALHLARPILLEHGITEREVLEVEDCILGTESQAIARSNEAKLVRAADLMGLAQPYEGFLADNCLLREEERLLGGFLFPWRQWKKMTEHVVGMYLLQDLRLSSRHNTVHVTSAFHEAARTNLLRFMQDPTLVD